MMTETDYRCYNRLLQDSSLPLSQVPSGVANSATFQGLLTAGILQKERQGRGFLLRVAREDAFGEFFRNSFPEAVAASSRASSIRRLRNSKAGRAERSPVFFLRGFSPLLLNGTRIDLHHYTTRFGFFGLADPVFSCDRICFVENLECFQQAEKRLGTNYIFAHKYGRIGRKSLAGIQAREVLVFVDYDFTGLAEFLRIQAVYPQATLYIPDNYDELFRKYSCSLSEKQTKMPERVRQSQDPAVVKIREDVVRHNRFLEQEILMHD